MKGVMDEVARKAEMRTAYEVCADYCYDCLPVAIQKGLENSQRDIVRAVIGDIQRGVTLRKTTKGVALR